MSDHKCSIDINSLKEGAHIHLIGICGTAMGSLAGILKGMGFHVTGSDQNVYPPMSTQLQSLGIEIMQGYKKENLDAKPDLVIVGNVIQKVFEESQALLASDIPYTSLPEAMGEFIIADRQSVVVAGTHGKTTTTSMMAWVAESCGHAPGFLIGGIPKNFGQSFQVPKADLFVIEGDEYDTAFFAKVPKFIYYKPKYVILNGVEFDHADIYDDIGQVEDAFKELIDRIPEDGVLVANGDCKITKKLIQKCRGKVITFGHASDVDYLIGDKSYSEGKTIYSFTNKQSNVLESIEIAVFGDYNISNSLAAYLLSIEMGWDKKNILSSLKSFAGVKRRQEIIGRPNDITIIEDFAHHPTAVGMTIEAIQKSYPGRRVFSVFEPRSATSRRKVFEEAYIEALAKATNVLLAKPYDQTRIPEEDRLSADNVIEKLNASSTNASLLDGADAIVESLKSQAKPNDVILIMSNGGFDGIYEKLLGAL